MAPGKKDSEMSLRICRFGRHDLADAVQGVNVLRHAGIRSLGKGKRAAKLPHGRAVGKRGRISHYGAAAAGGPILGALPIPP